VGGPFVIGADAVQSAKKVCLFGVALAIEGFLDDRGGLLPELVLCAIHP